MLSAETPFPYQGSSALYIDRDLPPSEQRAELVRIISRRAPHLPFGETGAQSLVSFPLRTGASGNKVVPEAELIDITPLDQAERKEMAELFGHLLGRERLTPKMKRQKARHDALKNRSMWADFARPLIADARRLSEKRKAA